MPNIQKDERAKLFAEIRRATADLEEKMRRYQEVVDDEKKATQIRKRLKK